MAKMKTPTLEEVKEYFKYAETIETEFKRKVIIKNNDLSFIDFNDCGTDCWFYFSEEAKNKGGILWSRLKGYSKILSYKEPKEKTYKITREQILDIHKNSSCNSKYDIEQLFPEVFETKLTVGKWYWSHNRALWCVEAFESSQRITAYGFNAIGDWSNSMNRQPESLTEATDQEVTEALTREAVKRGFKEGDYVRYTWFNIDNGVYKPTLNGDITYNSKENCLYIGETRVFNNGQWAEIIPTLTIPEAEEKLKEIGVNAKIV